MIFNLTRSRKSNPGEAEGSENWKIGKLKGKLEKLEKSCQKQAKIGNIEKRLCFPIFFQFFPIISNTTLGLNSVDKNLSDMFKLYGASPWQTLIYLRFPSALPYFLGGLRISGGLALIGAVVAEFVAGTGGSRSGIAYQILMSSYNLQIPRMFAALFLTTGLGIAIFLLFTVLSDSLLKDWHESVTNKDV